VGSRVNSQTLYAALAAPIAVLLLGLPIVSMGAPRAILVLKGPSGELVRLSDYRGKVVVLNFWATWCGPCREEMLMLMELEKEYGGRGVVIIGASLDDARTSRQIPDYLSKLGVKYPIWYGATGDDVARFGLGEAVPDTVFIDPEGQVTGRVAGEIRRSEVRERLDWLLGDRSRPAPETFVSHLGNEYRPLRKFH
jgi:thiol-disulfide isomerase/thioredoxin